MQKKRWTAVLLGIAVLLSGCSREEPVYRAGLSTEDRTETQTQEDGGSAERAGKAAADDLAAFEAEADGENDFGTSGEDGAAQEAPETAAAAAGCIYVCGAVLAPGVYPLREGMRVYEAVALAGGFAPDADEEWLNQAEQVEDGQRLYVYTKQETKELKEAGIPAAAGAASDASGDPASGSASVNLNTAGIEELMTLPGIGEAKAEAILQYREEHGAFGSIEEIQNISGIKSGVFARIRDRITV